MERWIWIKRIYRPPPRRRLGQSPAKEAVVIIQMGWQASVVRLIQTIHTEEKNLLLASYIYAPVMMTPYRRQKTNQLWIPVAVVLAQKQYDVLLLSVEARLEEGYYLLRTHAGHLQSNGKAHLKPNGIQIVLGCTEGRAGYLKANRSGRQIYYGRRIEAKAPHQNEVNDGNARVFCQISIRPPPCRWSFFS